MFNVTFAMGSCRHRSLRGHRSLHRREPGRTSHGLRGVAYMALGLLSLISTRPPALDTTTGVSSIGEWEAAWTNVLSPHVDDSGRVDFDSLRRNHADLDLVVAFVAAVDPITQPRQFPDKYSRLAFYINAYNALAMYGVVQAGVPESLGGLTKFVFFYLRKFTIGGKPISLSKFEDDVIRPLGDERIHFALNCMVVSCPKLPRVAFSAAALPGRLYPAARPFTRDPPKRWLQ